MESGIFRAGVLPGAPSTEDEIRMLLCYMLEGAGEPLSFDQLFDALSEGSLVNYFELIEELRYLEELGGLAARKAGGGQKLYRVTERGSKIAAEFERQIPLSARERALSSVKKVLARERRKREVKTSRAPSGGGFVLELAIPDAPKTDNELISIRVFVPAKEECDLLEARFLNAPATVYKGVMALLSGDEEMLGKIFTDEDRLF
ncbi:MAG: DUF4364 family protein [Oscillospiraceae bacterium]|nr:DUF4364 family protein [Oscillospiraceae bacterium]